MSAPVIRMAAGGDWPRVRAVRLRALADAPGAFASTLAREEAFPDAVWHDRVAGGNWVLADDATGPVGLAAGVPTDTDSERALVAMWVAPHWRGTGLAGDIVNTVAQWAAGTGASTLSLWVVDGNIAARRLYERMGFVSTGERQPLPSDPAIEEECMRRVLSV